MTAMRKLQRAQHAGRADRQSAIDRIGKGQRLAIDPEQCRTGGGGRRLAAVESRQCMTPRIPTNDERAAAQSR